MFSVFSLVKGGFGSVAEIESWDTPMFLDAHEFLSMQNDVNNQER